MAVAFQFGHSVPFSPETATETLRAIPALPGVFALHGPQVEGQPTAEPYLTRAADLRRRITRMVAPPDSQSKRLNLRSRVARIDFTITGSEFESALTLYHASAAIFGIEQARRRLKLRTPFFLRFAAENAYPRVYSTNRLNKRALDCFYGPFPSRAAADRYCDAVLDLFKLRRCVEDLAPYPEHPGCIYGEMNKCLAPCNQACTPAGAAAYASEAAAVRAFFDSHGESMLSPLAAEREAASVELDFERAAALHAQWQKVKAAASLADELVAPIPRLRAIIVQKVATPSRGVVILSEAKDPRISSEVPPVSKSEHDEPSAAIFLLHSGCLTGPTRLSTLGVRAAKEQTSVGSSLFAQPLMLEPVPLGEPIADAGATDDLEPPRAAPPPAASGASPDPCSLFPVPSLSPEARAASVIASLQQTQGPAGTKQPDLATLSDHLSLLRRWYYRPEKHRVGEIFFPKEDNAAAERPAWPLRRILNAAARAALGETKPIQSAPKDYPRDANS